VEKQGKACNNSSLNRYFSSACSTASPSPRILRPDYFFSMEVSPTSTAPFDYSTTAANTTENRSPAPENFNGHRRLQAMDTLKQEFLLCIEIFVKLKVWVFSKS
jgi:hypothetical protein